VSSIDQQFIEFIVRSLVSNPDAVRIERRIDEKGVLLELTVDPEDLGRVIGKRGATAQSLRTLLRALGTKNNARYNLKIVDNGVSAQASDDASARSDADDDDGVQSGVAAQPVPQVQSSAYARDNDDVTDDDLPSVAKASDPSEARTSLASKTRKELEELDDLDV
jgi:uncharacterized protein